MAERYETRKTRSGHRYIVRRAGSRPLLLISALGVPLSVWSRFLSDPGHDFRIVVVENRCGDLFDGGMRSTERLDAHADDIAEVLEDPELREPLDVVSWCNGGRIGAQLGAKHPGHVKSMVFVSTTWRGIANVPAAPCAFEDSLEQIFVAIRKNPKLAVTLAGMVRKFVKAPDWDSLANDDVARARELCRMPAIENSTALLAPMQTPDRLINYSLRTAADEAFPIAGALGSLASAGIPVLLITGEHDNVISNSLALDALRASCGRVTHACVSGAGHYVHDLQYRYFRWLLESFLATGSNFRACARVQTDLRHAT